MTDDKKSASSEATLLADVARKTARRLLARRTPARVVSVGVSMMGLIGWSVTVPTLLGAALGVWLDNRHAGKHSWTLSLLICGLAIGCTSAWYWLAQQEKIVDDNGHENETEHEDGTRR